MTVERFVFALLIVATAAPLVVPLVQWLFKRRSSARRGDRS